MKWNSGAVYVLNTKLNLPLQGPDKNGSNETNTLLKLIVWVIRLNENRQQKSVVDTHYGDYHHHNHYHNHHRRLPNHYLFVLFCIKFLARKIYVHHSGHSARPLNLKCSYMLLYTFEKEGVPMKNKIFALQWRDLIVDT
uniref:Uncharacterized protein n=1 Tax=Glossina pallidipes TaxID=7398 RepID=A0A1A9ZVN3_GLOPL